MQFNFGSGQMFGIDAAGVPLRFGGLQDVSVDFSGDTKELFGQEQFALAVARGKSKIECKAAFANIDLETYNALYFGQTLAAGHSRQATNEAGTIPTTPFTITAANGANFELDLGVFFVTTGERLTQVGSAATPAAGQYKVSAAGVYTFASADTGKAVLLNYLYTVASTGEKLTINNQLMGSVPVFGAVLSQIFQGKLYTLRLMACVADKLSSPFKADDFSVPELTFRAQANDAGAIGYIATSTRT